jgi:hypothetical protein
LLSLGLPAETWTRILWEFSEAMKRLDSHAIELRIAFEGLPSRANVWARSAFLGGSGGVLAEAQLPCGVAASELLWQRYDSGDQWSAELAMLAFFHESLHSLGLDHDPRPGSILNPSLGVGHNHADLDHPANAGVVEALRARYPRLAPPDRPPTPTPSPTPTPPGGQWITLTYLAPGGRDGKGIPRTVRVWTV